MNGKVWERAALKERAKVAFKRSYWWCVLAGLILMLVIGRGSGSSGRDKDDKGNKGFSIPSFSFDVSDIDREDVQEYVVSKVGGGAYTAINIAGGIIGGLVGLILLVVVLAIVAVALILRALLFNPLEVGGRKFFMENACEKKEGIGTMLDGFQNGYYGNVVVAMLVRDVKIFLWSLLLVIPGIIKAYEYRMVPYILAEHPELNYREVLNMSSEMMNGQKMNAFVLDLSFIGWYLLSGITGGIAGIFWVNPYVYATDAELYLELSTEV